MSIDILIAVFTPSSAVAAFFLWDSEPGRLLWNTLITIASGLALSKPFLRLEDRIEGCVHSHGLYNLLAQDLNALRMEISLEGKFTADMKDRFRELLARKRKISKETELVRVSKKKAYALYEEVNSELPSTGFFVPKS